MLCTTWWSWKGDIFKHTPDNYLLKTSLWHFDRLSQNPSFLFFVHVSGPRGGHYSQELCARFFLFLFAPCDWNIPKLDLWASLRLWLSKKDAILNGWSRTLFIQRKNQSLKPKNWNSQISVVKIKKHTELNKCFNMAYVKGIVITIKVSHSTGAWKKQDFKHLYFHWNRTFPENQMRCCAECLKDVKQFELVLNWLGRTDFPFV